MMETEREILQKVNYLVDLFHDAAIYKARYEKERALRGKLQNAVMALLPFARKWSFPPDDGAAVDAYDEVEKALKEAVKSP